MITEEERLVRDRRMFQLYESGWTLQEIADGFGLRFSKVWRIFETRRWPRRRTGPRSSSD